jgi:hypothetical protein
MHTLEINLKQSPLPLIVQKETLEAAQADYQRVLDALRGTGGLIELTCDQVTEKRISVVVQEIAAIQLYEKSGTASASGKPPGFFALLGEQAQ